MHSVRIKENYDGSIWIIKYPDGATHFGSLNSLWMAGNTWCSKHGGIVYAIDNTATVIRATEYENTDGEGFRGRELQPWQVSGVEY